MANLHIHPDIIKEIILSCYPVGSIYMSTSSTNPSSYFGGTWIQWGSGRVPVGVDTSLFPFSTVEKTGGYTTHSHASSTTGSHTLTTSEIPAHSHTRGTMNITGDIEFRAYNGSDNNLIYAQHGALEGRTLNTWSGSHDAVADKMKSNGQREKVSFDASKTWSGSTSSVGGSGGHTHTIPKSDEASTLQPYITCYMWKRTE